MIQAKTLASELRPGNYVYFIDQQIHRVESVGKVFHPQGGFIDGKPARAFYPIPLNPMILEKCGFAESDAHMIDNGTAIGYVNGSILLYGSLYEGSAYWMNVQSATSDLKGRYVQPHIQYLHQLQNLYFALTGSELPISLPTQ